MYTTRDAMLMDYAYVAEGQVVGSQLCPSCEGGATGEKSLSVGRTNGVLWWRCHRNSCPFRGGGAVKKEGEAPVWKPRGMQYVVEELPDDVATYLSNKFYMDEAYVRSKWLWTEDYTGRVVMPIFNEHGHRVGDNLRSFYGKTPKALINKLEGFDGGSWHLHTKYPKMVVVVEDMPSAERLHDVPGVNAIALLGTYLSDELSNRITRAYPGVPVILSLDNDATSNIVLTVVNARRLMPTLRGIQLTKDIKDMTPDELKAYVSKL